MANKVKKLFIVGALATGLFMSLCSCNQDDPSAHHSSDSNSALNDNSSSNQSEKNATLESITAVNNRSSYEWGEELDVSVFANYSDGSSRQIDNYQVQGYNGQISGDHTVLFSYEGKTCSLDVRVNDPIIVSISAEGNKDTYVWGEDLNLEVKATYSDGSVSRVDQYEVGGFDSKNPGNQTVTIKYEGKTCSFDVLVNNPALTGITVSNYKDTYDWGEDLDLDVKATYEDESSKAVSNYEVEGFNKEKAGNQTVTVKYEDQSFTFDVLVNNPKMTSITAISNKDNYEYGEALDVTVYANYEDGTSEEISSYSVDGYNSKISGLQNVTIAYEGKSCSLDVAVKERVSLFPTTKLDSFLQLENVETVVPSPIGYEEWTNSVEKEQDGSNYFVAKTDDEGTVGVDSIADQYAALLNKENWNVERNNGFYTATYYEGDVILRFNTTNNCFSLRVESYIEFPDSKLVGSVLGSKYAIKDGMVVVLGNYSDSAVIKGFDNGALVAVDGDFNDRVMNTVDKDAWRFTLNQSGDYWTISDINGRKLGATGLGQLTWDEGSTEWKFTLTGKSTIIANAVKEYGRLVYDSTLKAITTYESTSGANMDYPQFFKLSESDIIYPTAISLDGRDSIGTGRASKLSLKYEPENANSLNDVFWSSSNEDVAIVDEKGMVTGVSVGNATITAKTKSRNAYLETSYDVEIREQVLDSWTIMLYVCGSNLESGSGLASADIAEILKVSGQPDDVNIILETGGTTYWHRYGIDANALSRYHVENKQLVLDQKLPKVNMGQQSTFESFLTWGLQEYPAEKTGVILWNHGGALGGCCYDDSTGWYSDSLVASETASAYNNVFTANSISKLEFVGYDACLMQVQDIADFNAPYFNYMIGSEETENGEGWAYSSWIDDVYDGADTRTILKANCDGFISYYGLSCDQTLSYLDLSKMNNYREKFEAMAAAIKSTAKANWSAFKSIISKTYSYYGFSSYGLIDGLDFLDKLDANASYDAFDNEIAAAKAAYNELVGYSKCGTGAGASHGLAIVAATSSNCSYPSSETHFNNWRSIFK